MTRPGYLIQRTGLTGPGPARGGPAPSHVDVAATWLQPLRGHIDVVAGAARAAPVRTMRTTGSTGTTRPAPQALTLREPHPCHIAGVGPMDSLHY